MTNPFHDEKGRFCSQNGMKQAIARVAEKGNINDALDLKNNYERFSTLGEKTPNQERVEDILRISRSLTTTTGLPANVALQKYSVADIKEAEKSLKTEKKTLQEDKKTIQKKMVEIQKAYEEDSGTNISLHEAHYKVNQLENEAKAEIQPTLKEIREEAIAAGIPKLYAGTYIAKLQAKVGIENYTDPFNRSGDIYNKPLKEITPTDFSTNTRPKTHGEKFREIAEKYAQQGKFANFNQTVEQKINPAKQSYNKFQQDWNDQNIAHSQTEKAQNEVDKKLAVLNEHKQWRETVKETGISKYASLTETGTVNQNNIRTDKEGKILNVWGVTENINDNGKTVRTITPIRTVKPAWQVRENQVAAHSFVDEKGKTYVSVTHYANFRTSSSRSYVIVDPTVKGDKQFTETNPDVKNFSYSYDSGD